MIKILQIKFRNDINLGHISTDFLDLTKLEHAKLTVTEKGNFIFVAGIATWPPNRRKRIPMSNVTEINEAEEEPVVAKPKEDSGIAMAGTSGSLSQRAGEKPPAPLPAARVTAPETAS